MTLLLLLLLAFTALAIDTGRLVFADRQLQSIADLAAMSAARVTGPCSGAPVTDPGAVAATAQAAAGTREFQGEPYAGTLAAGTNVVLGTVTSAATGVRTFTATPAADAGAVMVALSETVPSSLLLPGFFDDTPTTVLNATAVAQPLAQASFSAGSFLASLDASQIAILNDILGGLLGGGSANLNAVSYDGLIGSDVSLGELAAAAGVGTVDEFMELDLTLAEFLDIAANAAQADNPDSAEVIVNDLIVAGGNLGQIAVDELIQINSPDPNAGASARFNLLDLLSAGIQLANKNQAVTVGIENGLPPPLDSVDLTLHIVEAPQLAGGPPGLTSDGDWRTEVHTSQVAVNVEAHSTPVDVPVGSGVLTTTADLALFVQAAQTSAHLASISCGGLLTPVHQIIVGAEPGIARVGLGHLENPGDPGSAIEPSPVIVLSVSAPLLGSATIPVTVAADLPLASPGAQALDYTADDRVSGPLPQQQTVGSNLAASSANAMDALISSTTVSVGPSSGTGVLGTAAGLLGFLGIGDLSAVAGPVADELLDPLLTELTGVLEVVQGALGINLGGADVTLIAVEADSVTRPDLLTGQPELVM